MRSHQGILRLPAGVWEGGAAPADQEERQASPGVAGELDVQVSSGQPWACAPVLSLFLVKGFSGGLVWRAYGLRKLGHHRKIADAGLANKKSDIRRSIAIIMHLEQ